MRHPIDHPVSRHAIDVIEGRVIAGELVTLACERHLKDLETGADRGLVFDCTAADRVINFAGMLQHTSASYAGRPLELEPWQVFRHGSVFGWKFEETGLRRFRNTYHQVGKKNGKTTDTAVPALFTQLFDREAAPEGYCTATKRDQAKLLFDGLTRVIKKSPFLPELMEAQRGVIYTPGSSGTIKALSKDSKGADGISPHFLAMDEMHLWEDRELAETLVQSMAARAQALQWVITTAGHNIRSICGETRTYAEDLLRGKLSDDRFFAYVAEPPADCDPADPVAWAMGNPNLDVSKPREFMATELLKAQAIKANMPNFRRFHLNLWTEGAQTWIGTDEWGATEMTKPVNIDKLQGKAAWVGVDMSRTTDLTSVAVAVPDGGLVHLIVYTWIAGGPKGFAARAMAENQKYLSWAENGWLEVIDGPVIGEDVIFARLKWIAEFFDVQEVAYDRWGMKSMVKRMEAARMNVVEHGQGVQSMSQPIKRFEEAVLLKRLRHGGNPVLEWAVGNVALDMDKAENLSMNKSKSRARIDPAVAAVMAVGRAMAMQVRRRTRAMEPV